jgi:hypothetical protein
VKRLLIATSLALAGCDDPLLEAEHISHTRVLGARVEAGGDPTRAWPRPGEPAHMTWLVADPRPSPDLGWRFSVCAAAEKTRGIPECAAPAFADLGSNGLSPALPEIDFTVPDATTLGGAKELLVAGAICSDEEPTTKCEGDGASVVFEIPLELSLPGNRNPSISDEIVLLDGAEWAPADPAWLALDACAATDVAPSLPVVAANGGGHAISITLSEDDRDANEELWISRFSTRGDLDGVLSVIAPGDSLGVKTTWKAPDSITDGRVVRFWFVVRDLRGGVDWAIRTLCATP